MHVGTHSDQIAERRTAAPLSAPLLVWLVGLLVLVTTVAHAGPPERAAASHRLAVKYYQRGDIEKALEAWREADRLDPSWKYAFNIASALIELDRPAEAWEANRRALRYGVPSAQKTVVDAQREKLEATLSQSHAWIELTVVPADAQVTRNGEPWLSPRMRWTAEPASELVIARDGYVTQTFRWGHPRGERTQKTVTLERKQKHGDLIVEGTPAGAVVKVRGAAVGTLPRYEGSWATDTYQVEVVLEGHTTWRDIVQIRANATARIRVVLEPAPIPKTTIVSSSDGDGNLAMTVAKWSTLGLAVASAATSGGLFGLAASTKGDLEELNEKARNQTISDYDAYRLTYEDKSRQYDRAEAAAWALLAVSIGATAATVTLFVLDAQEDEPDPEASFAPIVVPSAMPSGAAIHGIWRF